LQTEQGNLFIPKVAEKAKPRCCETKVSFLIRHLLLYEIIRGSFRHFVTKLSRYIIISFFWQEVLGASI
jgi:hypothetical protein